MKHWQSASDLARCRGKPYNGGRKRISFYGVCAFYVQMLICDPFHKRGMCRARGWGKRVETVSVYPLNSRFPLFLSLTQTRDRRPLRKGERQSAYPYTLTRVSSASDSACYAAIAGVIFGRHSRAALCVGFPICVAVRCLRTAHILRNKRCGNPTAVPL